MSFIFLYFISLKISPSSVPEDLKPKLRKWKGEQNPTAESSQNVKKKEIHFLVMSLFAYTLPL